jgi:hypothetical protein
MDKIRVDEWTTAEQRHDIAERYKRQFKTLVEDALAVQGDPFTKSFSFIRGRDLLAAARIPRFQDFRQHLVPYSASEQNYFISYRWLDTRHPDPDGRQLNVLKRYIKPNACYWIDYACLPQPPMAANDAELLRASLARIPSLFYETHVLVLRHRGDGYAQRAWCFFETLAGSVIAREFSYLFEEPGDEASVACEARAVLEATLLQGKLPVSLKVTNEADREPIERAARVTCTFFELNLLMHYLSLGQKLSNGRLYFGEHPYYLLATCDFSKVMLWIFDKSRELGLPLSDIARNEHSDNFFLKVAHRQRMSHNVQPAHLPRKVTMDQSKFSWFMIRRTSAQDPALASAQSLFFLLTSMLQ